MPELPEVETVARTLAPQICGRRIVYIQLLNAGTWQGSLPAEVIEREQPVICGTGRRGKLLLLYFGLKDCRTEGSIQACMREAEKNKPCSTACSDAAITSDLSFYKEIPAPDSLCRWPVMYTAQGMVQKASLFPMLDCLPAAGLAFHLRMTGRVFVYPSGTMPGRHTRAVFGLSDGHCIFFDDARKFGQVRAINRRELEEWAFWNSLGPEPLEMSEEDFISRFNSGRAIKSLLLEQSVLAGVGNIYADESLFCAGIRPDAPGRAIDRKRLRCLHFCLKKILLDSIRECGSSIRDYRTARGDVGAFQNKFYVYGRAGQCCLKCGTLLAAARTAGRGTVYCPHCQKH